MCRCEPFRFVICSQLLLYGLFLNQISKFCASLIVSAKCTVETTCKMTIGPDVLLMSLLTFMCMKDEIIFQIIPKFI